MQVFYDPVQKYHILTHEIISGKRFRHHEKRQRIAVILKQLKSTKKYTFNVPTEVPYEALASIHDESYLQFLSKSPEWAKNEIIWPYVFPCDKRLPVNEPVTPLTAGYYCFDVGTPIMHDTWRAAIAAASGAYAAAKHTRKTRETTYALARPPGHHALQNMFGGYCYLNNAAIAANYLAKYGKVLLIDFDFHHGNGSQSIFYDRNDVFYLSLHGNPEKEYPYYTGFEHESGIDDGIDFNLNIPLENNCGSEIYFKELDKAITKANKISSFEFVVVSAGFDIAVNDPLGNFGFTVEDFNKLGKLINSLKKPTVIIQEGGYLIENLGANVSSFLEAFL